MNADNCDLQLISKNKPKGLLFTTHYDSRLVKTSVWDPLTASGVSETLALPVMPDPYCPNNEVCDEHEALTIWSQLPHRLTHSHTHTSHHHSHRTAPGSSRGWEELNPAETLTPTCQTPCSSDKLNQQQFTTTTPGGAPPTGMSAQVSAFS